MNAEEIVQALRICNRTKGHRCSECPVFSRYAHGICKRTVDRTAANLIESLQAQLAESQRREQAAVEQIEQQMVFDAQKGCEPCEICSNADKTPCEECNPKWRGLQAGKGEAE